MKEMVIQWEPVELAPVVIFKRGTLEDWHKYDPILGVDEVARNEPSGKFKVGTGHKRWSELSYSTKLPHTLKFYKRVAPPPPPLPWWKLW